MKQSIKLAEKLGFQKEGTLRQMFPPDDAVLLGMLRSECKWLKIKDNNYGKVKTISTAST
jgi:RimJ/RimL family protein N-acetyltransferase